MKKELELYIHIPFCVRKCAYCDFLSNPANQEMRDGYVNALIKEIRAYGEMASEYMVTTIFLGGGTPSILEGVQMMRIFESIRATFEISQNVEITIEANPGTVTRVKLQAYREVGINRISFGLQSVNNDELKMLGRIHTYEEFLESYQLARESGFDNINIDLISAIPKQTLKSWEETLQKVINLQPEHISAYSLIIEEGTPFAEIYGEGCSGEKELPSEEEEREIYKRTEELLGEAGYHRYEISNYAKEGKECRHNLGYWERREYLGIGLGASSLINNVRFHNTGDLSYYMECVTVPEKMKEDIEHLTNIEQMEEFIFLGLRKTQGISMKEFEEIFGKSIWECYGENIERLQKQKLIEIEQEILRLTRKGIDVSNYVFAEILG